MAVAPPKFGLTDFEKMIEKAMMEAGEAPPAQPAAAKTAPSAPTNDKANDEKPPANPGKKKKNEAAAALLEKRKRYDPRQALKKGKKGTAAKKTPGKPKSALGNSGEDAEDEKQVSPIEERE